MTLVTMNNAWRVTTSGTIHGVAPWAMVWGVYDEDSPTESRASDIKDTFVAWYTAQIKTLVVDDMTLDQITVLDLRSAIGISVVYPISPAIAGDETEKPAGSQVAVMVTLYTGMRGRAYRGRKFLPGIAADRLDDAGGTSLEPATVAVITTRFTALNTALHAMASSPSLGLESKSRAEMTPITSLACRYHLGGQARRRNNRI